MTKRVSVKICMVGAFVICSATLASAQVSNPHRNARHANTDHVYAGRSQNPEPIAMPNAVMCCREAHTGYVTVSNGSRLHPRTQPYDPYHLPDSYNYDWPYGEGLGH